MKFYGDDGIALITKSKIDQSLIERIIYFEPTDIGEFTKIWGGSKFIKRAEANLEEIKIASASGSQTVAKTLTATQIQGSSIVPLKTNRP